MMSKIIKVDLNAPYYYRTMSLGVPFSAFCLMEGEGRYSDVDPDFEPVDLDPGGS